MKQEIKLRKATILLYLVILLFNVPLFFVYFKQGGFWGFLNIFTGIFVCLLISIYILEALLKIFLITNMNYKEYGRIKWVSKFIYLVVAMVIVLYIVYVYRFIFILDGSEPMLYNQSYTLFFPCLVLLGTGGKKFYVSDSHTIIRIDNRLVKISNEDVYIKAKEESKISSKMTSLELMAGGSIAYVDVLNEEVEEVSRKLA